METKRAFSRKKMKQHNISCQQHETILLYLPSQQGKKQEVSWVIHQMRLPLFCSTYRHARCTHVCREREREIIGVLCMLTSSGDQTSSVTQKKTNRSTTNGKENETQSHTREDKIYVVHRVPASTGRQEEQSIVAHENYNAPLSPLHCTCKVLTWNPNSNFIYA